MLSPPKAEFSVSLPRVRRWIVLLSVGGGAVLLYAAGTPASLGFLVGSIASWYNFSLLHAVVERLGPDPKPGSRRIISLFALRYLGLAALGYVTLRVFGSNPAAFCTGLLVAPFAMLFDSIFELIYART
ncbi:MAG: ATP synthase subunit I [Bryobacterales bacterium]|nr:ATP synthase subunit I [Bryobacterales bacterium]